jgi:hypothetical protein
MENGWGSDTEFAVFYFQNKGGNLSKLGHRVYVFSQFVEGKETFM